MEKRKLYAEFIKAVDILSINLVKIKGDLKLDPQEVTIATDRVISLATNYAAIRNQDQIVGRAEIILRSSGRVKNKKRSLVAISGTWRLEYVLSAEGVELFENMEQEQADDLIKIFSGTNVPVNVWPFVRAEVVRLSTSMGIPPITLSVMRRV